METASKQEPPALTRWSYAASCIKAMGWAFGMWAGGVPESWKAIAAYGTWTQIILGPFFVFFLMVVSGVFLLIPCLFDQYWRMIHALVWGPPPPPTKETLAKLKRLFPGRYLPDGEAAAKEGGSAPGHLPL